MAWQGIPFPFESTATDHLSVALSSIPKIILDTPTDITTPLLTAVAAIIGGLIPAAIAWRTFKQGSKQLQNERLEQQKFLVNEREVQQNFLREERLAQIESLEADRKTQLTISERSFNLQVLSVNRQSWINSLRDLIAEYGVQAYIKFDVQHEYHIKNVSYERLSGTENFSTENEIKIIDELTVLRAAIESERRKLELLLNKIELMLNPSEELSKTIVYILYRLRAVGSGFREGKEFKELHDSLRSDISELVKKSQECLKSEWSRVKQGN